MQIKAVPGGCDDTANNIALDRTMKVADAMTEGLISIRSDASVLEALHLMLELKISGLPVINAQGNLAGMVTEGDFLRRAELGTEQHHPHWLEFLLGPGRLAGEYVGTHGRKVGEIMSGDVVTVADDAPLSEAVRLMEHHHIKRLPVIRRGHVIGMLSRADLLRSCLAVASVAVPADTSDEGIRRSLLLQIDRLPWGPRATVAVAVKDGVVTLHGVIGDERTRAALKVLAENATGVKAVCDQLTTIDSNSGMVVQNPPETA